MRAELRSPRNFSVCLFSFYWRERCILCEKYYCIIGLFIMCNTRDEYNTDFHWLPLHLPGFVLLYIFKNIQIFVYCTCLLVFILHRFLNVLNINFSSLVLCFFFLWLFNDIWLSAPVNGKRMEKKLLIELYLRGLWNWILSYNLIYLICQIDSQFNNFLRNWTCIQSKRRDRSVFSGLSESHHQITISSFVSRSFPFQIQKKQNNHNENGKKGNLGTMACMHRVSDTNIYKSYTLHFAIDVEPKPPKQERRMKNQA